jgi:transposase
MEKGRLHWPSSGEGRAQLTREEFALLIGGIDLSATTKRRWHRRVAKGEPEELRKGL